MTQYDDNNIFARILRGEIPCHEVWQDEVTRLPSWISIRGRQAMTLVLPKTAARNIFDAEPAVLGGADDAGAEDCACREEALRL